MFSRKEIADFINQTFEPVWESVRAVPIVRVDFGNGRVITRTLHGNIATYVCDSGGRVLDVLPGIYEPRAYVDRLTQLQLLSRYVNAPGIGGREALLTSYHQRQAGYLTQGDAPARLIAAESADFSKIQVERSTKILLMPPARAREQLTLAANLDRQAIPRSAADELAEWSNLTADTRLNETVRRRQIHEFLAGSGPVRPNDIKKWLYKDVLHADLDDPYLGLQPILSSGYPFKDNL